jgi:hypothetical protein
MLSPSSHPTTPDGSLARRSKSTVAYSWGRRSGSLERAYCHGTVVPNVALLRVDNRPLAAGAILLRNGMGRFTLGTSCPSTISRPWPDRHRSRASTVRHESAASRNAGSPAPSCESACGRPPARVGRPMRRRLVQAHDRRKSRRCQAMTVSGLTITSVVRHPPMMAAKNAASRRSGGQPVMRPIVAASLL